MILCGIDCVFLCVLWVLLRLFLVCFFAIFAPFLGLLTRPESSPCFCRDERRVDCVKIPLLVLGLLVSVSVISKAGPARGGSHGGGFHSGVLARAAVNRGGFQGAFRTGNVIRRGFADRRFYGRNRVFQQYGWPVYWYPGYGYDDSLDYSYLEPDSQPDYQYWDNSPASQQEQPTKQAVPQRPVVLVVNAGNARPTEYGPSYGENGYNYNAGLGQQRVAVQDPSEHPATDPMTPGDPVVPQATPVPQPNTKTSVQRGTGPFKKLVVVSYLNDRGKDVISVKNTETNDVQRITSQPNIDHFRIVEIHPNPDQRQFEAIISNGTDQGPVRFQF
jgi:hypothetical protein